MCWFKRRFCRTANIRRAPRRAFDRPIMFAARSVRHGVSFMFIGTKMSANLALKRRACGLLHLDYALFPLLTVVGQAVSTYRQAKESL